MQGKIYNMFNIGFTGPRSGMIQSQKDTLKILIKSFQLPITFHHGDCIGADEEANEIASRLCRIHIHPPLNPRHRAWCLDNKDITYRFGITSSKPLDYIPRNHAIVDTVDLLIGAPIFKEKLRSGTWSTIRYARNRNKPWIILPFSFEGMR